MLNGYKRKNESIQKIIDARNELEQKGQKITKKRISEISGLSPKTVRAHINTLLINMDEIVEMINNSVELNLIIKEERVELDAVNDKVNNDVSVNQININTLPDDELKTDSYSNDKYTNKKISADSERLELTNTRLCMDSEDTFCRKCGYP